MTRRSIGFPLTVGIVLTVIAAMNDQYMVASLAAAVGRARAGEGFRALQQQLAAGATAPVPPRTDGDTAEDSDTTLGGTSPDGS